MISYCFIMQHERLGISALKSCIMQFGPKFGTHSNELMMQTNIIYLLEQTNKRTSYSRLVNTHSSDMNTQDLEIPDVIMYDVGGGGGGGKQTDQRQLIHHQCTS